MSIDNEMAELEINPDARMKVLCEDIAELIGDLRWKEVIAVWPMSTSSSSALPTICMSEGAARALFELATIGLCACRLPTQAKLALAAIGSDPRKLPDEYKLALIAIGLDPWAEPLPAN